MSAVEERVAEGKASGEAEVRSEMLLELLTRKFGRIDNDTEARVRTGTLADVARWAERAVTVDRIDAVFAQSPGPQAQLSKS